MTQTRAEVGAAVSDPGDAHLFGFKINQHAQNMPCLKGGRLLRPLFWTQGVNVYFDLRADWIRPGYRRGGFTPAKVVAWKMTAIHPFILSIRSLNLITPIFLCLYTCTISEQRTIIDCKLS